MRLDRPFCADPGRALQRALATLFDAPASLVAERPWASITFVGRQHRLVIEGASRLDRIAGLVEEDFPIPGHFVGSIAVSGEHRIAGRTDLVVDALTIEAA